MTIANLPTSVPIRSFTPPVVVADLARISVEQYDRMVANGALGSDDKIELLDGLLVQKMSKSPDHVVSADVFRAVLAALLPNGWCLRGQDPLSLDTSVPEPDLAVVRGKITDYRKRHPNAEEVALVVEVAESSLSRDRNWKRSIYARNSIPVYWIVNLIARTLEVSTDPTGPCEVPAYRQSKIMTLADRVDFPIKGSVIATFPVADLIPEAA